MEFFNYLLVLAFTAASIVFIVATILVIKAMGSLSNAVKEHDRKNGSTVEKMQRI